MRLSSAPRFFTSSVTIALALVWTDLATAQDKRNSLDAGASNFVSCRKANAFKKQYDSIGIRHPESFYACDTQYDTMDDLLSPYKNFDEAYKQYNKDFKNSSEVKFSDYKYPRPYVLSKDELTSIIMTSIPDLEPNVFTTLGSNENAVFFLYKDATRRVGQDAVTVWYLTSYLGPQGLGMQFNYMSMKVQVALNCGKGSYADLQQTIHMGHRANGDSRVLLGREISEAKFIDIPPNTLYSMLQKELCAKPKEGKKTTK